VIIDAHAHACGDFLYGKNIIDILDRNDVSKVVIVPGELGSSKNYSFPDLAARFPSKDVVTFTNFMTKVIIGISRRSRQIDVGNEYVYTLAKEFPKKIIQFYWIRLSLPNALENLERDFESYRFKGIKMHQCWESFSVGSDIFHRVSEWATSKQLPIFVHLFSKKEATRLAQYIKTHRNTVFIVGHLFGLERYIEAEVDSDNVFFEISTPALISIQRLKMAIKFFGAERVVLGSDIPYGQNNLKTNIDRVKNLDISDEEKYSILGGNMKKLLKIK
jgi:predicted TIM-barrel fold metal-dependent hydrolase